MYIYESNTPFKLECGEALPSLVISYHTYGQLNSEGNNVVWICHALTANSEVASWWGGLVGPQKLFDTDKYFVVCANIIGSCYGTTGPLSINQRTGKPYYSEFPLITIRDMVNAHIMLCSALNIKKIDAMVGASMGGYQALEWCIMQPAMVRRVILIATAARETAWGIAIHTAQRMAIEADGTWGTLNDKSGVEGLKAARAIGMLTYRSYHMYKQLQTDTDMDKWENFKASSYLIYQGNKLANRFNAYSYWILTRSMDSHNVARGRSNSVEAVLQRIQQSALIIGISSDLLCPVEEQRFIATHIPGATLLEIDSNFGHDGFLTETKQISDYSSQWLNESA